ncbi:trehalose 6-phosphatase [Brevibacterium sanguinis]|uniref:Trehalose-phosphate phosphatase n=2 Tax=Brevibacterium TaxID=1696 RepID=A0A366IJ86_9MICO|nr:MULTISPECIES: trehalose-phosphatase [Brevibacterium]RBP65550.1 trehalose 6-phosphatase [Brevibacterium sanguinis]RBP72184.1 trehalose 6-phosphatase [Brevibacterium celere]
MASLTPDFTAVGDVDLRALASADRLLIGLDFDGVLAPLQDDPATSRMLDGSSRAIARLSRIPGTRVALVSGRDAATLRRLADPGPGVWLIGSHGAEVDFGADGDVVSPIRGDSAAGSEVGAPGAGEPAVQDPPMLTPAEQEMLEAIDSHIATFEHTVPEHSDMEIRVEHKPFARTVHTRGLDQTFASDLHEHVVQVQKEHPGIRVIEGHDIVELSVKRATKGDGMHILAEAFAPQATLYLGDDVTDEDAFAQLESVPGSVGIKVGPSPTRAGLRIADPEAVAELLLRLAEERERLRS